MCSKKKRITKMISYFCKKIKIKIKYNSNTPTLGSHFGLFWTLFNRTTVCWLEPKWWWSNKRYCSNNNKRKLHILSRYFIVSNRHSLWTRSAIWYETLIETVFKLNSLTLYRLGNESSYTTNTIDYTNCHN